MSDLARAEPEPVVTDDTRKVYTAGNLTLISSDNVRFRLPSYYLIAASKVFRDMQDVNAKESADMHVALTDTQIETAPAVRAWLGIITGRPLPADDNLPIRAGRIIPLARKFDCPLVESSTISLLYRWVDHATNSQAYDVVVLATMMDEPGLVAKVLRKYGTVTWADDVQDMETRDLQALPEAQCMDPVSWHDLRCGRRFGV